MEALPRGSMGKSNAINPERTSTAPEISIGRDVFMLAYIAMMDACIWYVTTAHFWNIAETRTPTLQMQYAVKAIT